MEAPEFLVEWRKMVYRFVEPGKERLPLVLYVNREDCKEYQEYVFRTTGRRTRYPRFRNVPVIIRLELDRGEVAADWPL